MPTILMTPSLLALLGGASFASGVALAYLVLWAYRSLLPEAARLQSTRADNRLLEAIAQSLVVRSRS